MTDVKDLVGVGFGPAGIALAAALEDWREERGEASSALFLESRGDSTWQPGLLIRGTDINHHFFRDFATPRNPRSRFTFANYLWEKGRLFEFGALDGPVGRVEWADYVAWTAEQLSEYVQYGSRVSRIQRESPTRLRIESSRWSGSARSLAINTGPIPHIPDEFREHLGQAFFHTSEYLSKLADLDRQAPLEFCVVGSGQSAAEILIHLHGTFPNSTLHSVHRSIGFRLVDVGHYSNVAYLPADATYFHSLAPADRAKLMKELHFTNYSSIDYPKSSELYWLDYEDRVQGRLRLKLWRRTRIEAIAQGNSRYELTLRDAYADAEDRISPQIVILATGFTEHVWHPLLDELTPWIEVDEDGAPRIDANYRIATKPGLRVPIYANGITERTHGISDSASFSMMALKSGSIAAAVAGAKQREVASK